MKEELVSFEVAKLAKEKGFCWATAYHYEHSLTERVHPEDGTTGAFGWEKGETNLSSSFFINNFKDCDRSNKNWFLCSAPYLSQLQRWLRDDQKIMVWCEPAGKDESDFVIWDVCIFDNTSTDPVIKIETKCSYEGALGRGLQKRLELI